jgi:hypothetical protein
VNSGASIAKALLVGGTTHFYSTKQSDTVTNGSLVIAGGVGIAGNVNIGGDTVLNGNLTVNGTTTTVVSQTTVLGDNSLVLNSGPSGSKDSGFIIQRYQMENDSGSGDVVNDTLFITDVLPLQGSVTSTQVKLSSAASAVNDFYNGWWIKVTSGFSNNQARKIVGYDGASRTVTLSTSWTSQNPSNGDYVFLYNKPYVGLLYNEVNDRFEFGGTTGDNAPLTDYVPVCVSSLSVNATGSGSLLSRGGISIVDTTDSTSLSTLGGATIAKTLTVGNGLVVNNVNMTPNSGDVFASSVTSANNNQSVPVDVGELKLPSSVWGFDVFLAIRVVASTNLYTNFHLRGVNKVDTWELVQAYVGDDTGIQFSITSDGQVQYTTPNYTDFTSCTFRWRVFTN